MSFQPRGCTNEDCQVAAHGKCLEGYPLDECPHVSRISVEDIEEIEGAGVARDVGRILGLSLGDPLDRLQASAMQRRRISRTVGIVGPNNAGKTSLLASVYDLLQDGPIDQVHFAGSSTLIGFEKICHDARAACRRDTPHMERTSAGSDATFYHLDLKHNEDQIVSVFLSDRSGEDYLAASDDLSRASEFFELRRADVVTLLVNGEHLAASEHRHETKAVTPQIVDALVEANSMRQGCRLAVVLTKQDAVLASPHAERVQQEFNLMVDTVVEGHGRYLGEIERFTVAASPKDSSKVKRGNGVAGLLHFWLRAALPPSLGLSAFSESTRMFDLLNSDGDVAR